MRKRGRPPYPDVLTPREWEVLAILSEGLTNEQIAEKLNITIHAARYHVSEILSKLGVSSRQEAAAWQREKARPLWAGALALLFTPAKHLPFGVATRAAGAAVAVAAAGGMGFLVWGLVVTSGQDNENGEGLAGSFTATPTVIATATGTPYPFPTFTPAPSPTPTPRPVVEGTGTPAPCLASSPNPYEAAASLGEPTRYARGIYSIGLDGGAPEYTSAYQIYSATPDGNAVVFVTGQQPGTQQELYLLRPAGTGEPRLLATFQGIQRLAIAPQGDRVAVQGWRKGGEDTSLFVVDTRDGQVTTLPLTVQWPGGEPLWSPDGDWLATAGQLRSEEPAGIVIMRPDGSGAKRLAYGGPPMAWSPDGSRIAYVIDHGLYTTDLEGNVRKISDSEALLDVTPTLAWSPSGRCLAFVSASEMASEGPIRVVDVETGWEVFLAHGGQPTWSPDGRRIAFVRDGNLWTMNIDASEQTRLTNPRQPFVREPSWLNDGSGLLFAFVPTVAESVYVVDADGANAANLADGARPVWSPDGTKIAFTVTLAAGLGAYGYVYVMSADGTDLRRMGKWAVSDALTPCRWGQPYAWTPDGHFVAYHTDAYFADDQQGVMLAPADGSSQPEVLVQGKAMDWSPDGQRFVYSASELTKTFCQIYLSDFPATGEPRWLTEGEQPVWSPDGQWIAFNTAETEPLGPVEMRVINVDGSGERKVMDISGFAGSPAWSPDGTRLAATAADGLFVVDLATGEQRKLAEGQSYTPAWSPDGTQIAFTVSENDSYSVYVVDADGSGQPRKLADGSGASWSPDGKRIAFGG